MWLNSPLAAQKIAIGVGLNIQLFGASGLKARANVIHAFDAVGVRRDGFNGDGVAVCGDQERSRQGDRGRAARNIEPLGNYAGKSSAVQRAVE